MNVNERCNREGLVSELEAAVFCYSVVELLSIEQIDIFISLLGFSRMLAFCHGNHFCPVSILFKS